MFHERGMAGLWRRGIRLYFRYMPKPIYNIRLVADGPLRKKRLDIFLDAYATSLDAWPTHLGGPPKRGADALWGDFVRISQDINKVVVTRKKSLVENDG